MGNCSEVIQLAAQLRISLLGQPSVETPTLPVRISSRKAQALLWYLASQPRLEFSRSHLAALLWADSPEPEGRQSLSTTLNRLRQTLPCWPIDASNDRLRWNGCQDIWVDTSRFLQLAASADDTAALSEAVDLWRGPFLEGYSVPKVDNYETWLMQERKVWENHVLQALTHLVESERALGEWGRAISYARRALLIDPLQERFHQAIMTCHYFAGDRGAALSQYTACERIMAEQLGVDPDTSTRETRDAILAGTLPRISVRFQSQPIEEPCQSIRPPEKPFAGRQQELLQLQTDLAAAAAGAKPAVLLHGDTGMGKSRLVQEVLSRLEPALFSTRVQARCQQDWEAQPLVPLVEALQMRPTQTGLEAPLYQLTQAVTERLFALHGPLLMVIEDLHWADRETCGLLSYLIRHCRGGQLSLLLTSRSYELPPARRLQLRRWEREGLLVWHDLVPLSDQDFTALVHSWGAQTDAGLIRLLQEETGSNPLYAVTILDALASEPLSQRPTSAEQLPLPPYLVSLVRERTGHLSSQSAALLIAVALRQRGVSLPDLERLTGLGPDVILDGLDELLATGFVVEDPPSERIRVPMGFVRRVITTSVSHARLRHLRAALEQAADS